MRDSLVFRSTARLSFISTRAEVYVRHGTDDAGQNKYSFRMPSKTSWTEEDLTRLRVMIESGASPARASVVFKRTVLSVQNQARKLGTPFPARRHVKGNARTVHGRKIVWNVAR